MWDYFFQTGSLGGLGRCLLQQGQVDALCMAEALDPAGFQPFPVLWEQTVLDTDVVLGGGTLDSDGDCRDISRALKDRLCIFSIDFFISAF